MRIAKYIDPAVFYDKNSDHPFIMSPYLACVNTLSAWPAPHRSHDAVLALENGNAQTESDDEHDEDEVPREQAQHDNKATKPKPIRYWSFQGFREDEISNTLQRKPTRESLLREERLAPVEEVGNREGSFKSQSTRYDEERLLTAENPSHGLALTRLGSYGRNIGVQRTSLTPGYPQLDNFAEVGSDGEELQHEDDDDNDSFHTAAEYIFENEVQPDGSVVPVKKKKGLSVKKVRKSLHIPSAKTVQKNMRGLSIKRKDKSEKKADLSSIDTDKTETSRSSTDQPATRKSIDLMRPFRFGHHEKDVNSSTNTRRSFQLERKHSGRNPLALPARASTSDERVFTLTSPTNVRTSSPGHIERPVVSNSIQHEQQRHHTPSPAGQQKTANSDIAPPIRLDNERNVPTSAANGATRQSADDVRASIRTDSSLTSIDTRPTAVQSIRSLEAKPSSDSPALPTHVTPSTVTNITRNLSEESSPRSSASATDAGGMRNPSKTTGQTTITGDALITPVDQQDGKSHRLDKELGPWRFSNPKIEPIEDTAFIFGDTSHSVKDRRKHFAKSPETREEFLFDPDIVYCMSFFLPYMNFNTFDLKLGPLGANLHRYVDDQPIRYMARSADRPDEVFFMVEFSLE